MSESYRQGRRRSLFWPVVLIGAGVIILLDNLGVFPAGVSPWAVMARYWPLILILIGIDMLVARSDTALSRVVGALLALGLVGAVIVLALVAPPAAATHDRWTLPAGGVEVATVAIDFADYYGVIESLRTGGNLLEADFESIGGVSVDASGSGGRVAVTIAPGGGFAGDGWLNPARWFDSGGGYQWHIQLAEDVPFERLTLRMDDGEHAVDLARVRVAALELEADDARIDLRLPGTLETGDIRLDDGNLTVRLPERSSALGVQIRIDLGDGRVHNNVPNLERVRSSGNGGTWETASFDEADHKIRLAIGADDGTIWFE
ncbi:MAG: hypothetical protein Kow00120_20380 [Anaerolineae bacterium]